MFSIEHPVFDEIKQAQQRGIYFMAHTPVERQAQVPPATDLYNIDHLLSEEERMVRDTVRKFVHERVLPIIGDHFEAGTFPRELIPEFAELGLLGMHLDGYGCAGLNAVCYGLACQELEAGDSGVRSFVSVQGSLAMFPIYAFGSEEQKQRWLPRMARGEALGCFGLTEPDFGSDAGSMRTNARRDGDTYILNGTKCGLLTAALPMLPSSGRVRRKVSVAFWSSAARPVLPPAISIASSLCAPPSPQNCILRIAACLLRICCRMCVVCEDRCPA